MNRQLPFVQRGWVQTLSAEQNLGPPSVCLQVRFSSFLSRFSIRNPLWHRTLPRLPKVKSWPKVTSPFCTSNLWQGWTQVPENKISHAVISWFLGLFLFVCASVHMSDGVYMCVYVCALFVCLYVSVYAKNGHEASLSLYLSNFFRLTVF